LGVMDRLVLSDAQWEAMSGLIIGRPDQYGSTGRDNRIFVERVLWIVRTGSPCRDLPEALGDRTACSAVSAVEREGCLAAHLRGGVGRSRLQVLDRRLHHRARPPALLRRKGGLAIRPSDARAAA